MPQSDPLRALEENTNSALLVDRRQLAPLRGKFNSVDVGKLWPSYQTSSGPLNVALLLPKAGEELPAELRIGSSQYLRLMDHFFVPQSGDLIIVECLFDLIADIYDRMASPSVNIATAKVLVEAVLHGDHCKLLDFGCGTGLIVPALAKIIGGPKIELLGTDVSDKMRRLAELRGEPTVSLSKWKVLPKAHFDAAVATFVVHYGISPEEKSIMAAQLRSGCALAMNYFKAEEDEISKLVADFDALGLRLEARLPMATTPGTANDMLVFRKPRG